MRRERVNLALIGSLLVALATPSLASDPPDPCAHLPQHAFFVNDQMNRNSVVFKSTAPLEDIIGTTGQIVGYMVFDPANPGKGGHGLFSVPVAGLETGIPLRDEHMRGEGWLDATTHPEITFRIDALSDITTVTAASEAQTYDVVARGEFTLRGITKAVAVQGRITYLKASDATAKRLPGDILAARARFTVTLADFGITGPAGMGVIGSKVGETVDVEISVMGSTASPAPASYPCPVDGTTK